MSYVKIWIHTVWGTHNRKPVLTREVRVQLFSHITSNTRDKGIYIDSIGGITDHVHCLFSLDSDLSVAKAMQLIKGESAYWINKTKLVRSRFSWAKEYFASSVSESVLPKVRSYIRNQELHHKKKTFKEEYDLFIEKSGLIPKEG